MKINVGDRVSVRGDARGVTRVVEGFAEHGVVQMKYGGILSSAHPSSVRPLIPGTDLPAGVWLRGGVELAEILRAGGSWSFWSGATDRPTENADEFWHGNLTDGRYAYVAPNGTTPTPDMPTEDDWFATPRNDLDDYDEAQLADHLRARGYEVKAPAWVPEDDGLVRCQSGQTSGVASIRFCDGGAVEMLIVTEHHDSWEERGSMEDLRAGWTFAPLEVPHGDEQ